MIEESISKKIGNGNFYRTVSVGETRTRWEDVQRDALQVVGIRGRKRRIGNRERVEVFFEGSPGPKWL
jgi:hypothetical protein